MERERCLAGASRVPTRPGRCHDGFRLLSRQYIGPMLANELADALVRRAPRPHRVSADARRPLVLEESSPATPGRYLTRTT